MNEIGRFSRLPKQVAIVAALLGATSAQAQLSDGVVRIGFMADMAGPYSGNGGPGEALAARMAIEDFGGKVLGRPIELIVADDQNKPNVGIATARQWVETEKVDAIVGGSASSIALGVSSMMKEKKQPYLLAGPLSSDLTGKACSPMTLQFLPDSYARAKASIVYALKSGVKTFFFITVDYTFGKAWQEDATGFIEAGGGKVVGYVRHPLGTTDFSSYLLQAQASGAQAIVLANAGADQANALKQAVEYRLARKGQRVMPLGGTENVTVALGPEIAEGLVTPTPFYWDRNDESRAFAKRFVPRNNGVIPGFIMSSAYSAVNHYLKAVQAAGTDDGPTVMAKMRSMPVSDFTMKGASIREDGQVLRPMYVVVAKGPSESREKNDIYVVKGELPLEDVYRPLAEGGCDLVTVAKAKAKK
jgi:branched-chain amino acid transport system substrate-binding protein